VRGKKMTRETKFRAWHKLLNEMFWFDVMWGNVYNAGSGYIGMLPIGEQRKYTHFAGTDNRIPLDPDDCELMQYTGLLDKNGKEGYHKDICTDGTNLYLIEWIATDAKFVLFQASEGILINDNVRRMRFLDEMEIIGDVYENPELVEQ